MPRQRADEASGPWIGRWPFERFAVQADAKGKATLRRRAGWSQVPIWN